MKTLLFSCTMILLTMNRTLGLELLSTVLPEMMFIREFQRITLGKTLQFTTFSPLFLGTRLPLLVAVERLLTAVQMITSSYTDHGGPGVLGMPSRPALYADELIDVLKQKHASGTYKSLVFYLEACESGSIFEVLPKGLNIYATTASNAEESSWGTYCPGEYPSPPEKYDTCLGDLYSVSWMEDSDVHNLRSESLHQQYELVKRRAVNDNFAYGSHVMQHGDIEQSKESLISYLGSDPANETYTYRDDNSLRPTSRAVNQRDAELLHFWHKFRKAQEGSPRKIKAQNQLLEVMSHGMHIDHSMKLMENVLFGITNALDVLSSMTGYA